MKRTIVSLIAAIFLSTLAGCSADPQIIVVEVTRQIPEIQEVEVTRVVEVEKEVTRIVEVPVEAQVPRPDVAAGLEFLQVEFWPDYDRPSVLVLLTGSLSENSAPPYVIAVPLPRSAEINAVAQIDEGGMTSIDYESAGDMVVFRSSTPRFRVEYYAPYRREGNARDYEFQWPAPFPVTELAVQIQRPFNAANMFSDPAPSGIVTDTADGLDYLLFDSVAVPQGRTYQLKFSYNMTADTLTIDELSGAPPDLPGSPLHDQQASNIALARSS